MAASNPNPYKNVPFGTTNPGPNILDNNDTSRYFSQGSTGWELGNFPVSSDARVIPNWVGNGHNGIGRNAPMLDVATPLVLPPAIIVVLQTPYMFTYDDGKVTPMAVAIKDMWESWPKTITGIDPQYSNEPQGQSTIGADTQTMSAPGKTVRQQVTPTISMTEINGNVFWNIIKFWLCSMNDPDTHAIGPNVNVRGGWSMSDYSMTFMSIQPDVTGRPDRILDAAVYCNVFPTATNELGMERQVGQMKPMERSFTFQAVMQHNATTKQLGKVIMEKLRLHQLDFNWAPPQRSDWTESLDQYGLPTERAIRQAVYGRAKEDGSYNVAYSEGVKHNQDMARVQEQGKRSVADVNIGAGINFTPVQG